MDAKDRPNTTDPTTTGTTTWVF